ncbi:hypothetical protein [Flagellimonas onchidii]|uniref:hypothetical protein n=1 Tax=Flagellimonas onchidii TaxID=2562684 RepID=UPI0010A5CF68|nr:hypothetical protein [Allomuricauda onchidii]
MIHLNFSQPAQEMQDELFPMAREHVEHLYKDSMRSHCDKNGGDNNKLMDEEAIKILYTYNHVFNIWFGHYPAKTQGAIFGSLFLFKDFPSHPSVSLHFL